MHDLINEATKEKHRMQYQTASELKIKDKRMLYNLMRTCDNLTPETFLPAYGMTFGEFCVYQVINNTKKKN